MDTNIPYFEDQKDKCIPGMPYVERDIAASIVYDPVTDSVLCMKWNEYDWKTLVIGGIDPGEDAVAGGTREIREETGYADIIFLGEVGKVRSAFYAKHKNENRITNATGLVFELRSNATVNVTNEEKEKHLPVWIAREEVTSFVNIDWQLYLLEQAVASGLLQKRTS